jgi:hypothetical protein
MTQLRGMALAAYNLSRQRDVQTDESKHSTGQRIVQSLKEPFRSDKKRHAGTPGGHRPGDNSAKRPRVRPHGDDDVIVVEDSEPEEGASKVEPRRHASPQRTQVNKVRVRTSEIGKVSDPKKILKLFRVDEKKLA